MDGLMDIPPRKIVVLAWEEARLGMGDFSLLYFSHILDILND